jgi:uncharacterized protein (DUF433 family)
MARIRWQERIVISPDLHHGDFCIKETRIPVAMIVGSLADGMTPEEILQAYPQLTAEDIQAALAYAAEVLRIVQMLKDVGYNAVGVIKQDMGGWKDAELWEAVQSERRFLITADKGFADIRLYPPGTHNGVLLLRPD